MPAAPALLAPPPPSFLPLPPLSYKQLSQTMLYWMYTGVGHPWEPEKPRSQNLLEKECVSFLPKLSVILSNRGWSPESASCIYAKESASRPKSLPDLILCWSVLWHHAHVYSPPQSEPRMDQRKDCINVTSRTHLFTPQSECRMDQRKDCTHVQLGELRSFYWRYLWKQKRRPKAAASAKSPPQQRWELTKAAALPEALFMAFK